jgi:hypothetical protein
VTGVATPLDRIGAAVVEFRAATLRILADADKSLADRFVPDPGGSSARAAKAMSSRSAPMRPRICAAFSPIATGGWSVNGGD